MLRWIGFSHFESDEWGALNEWLKVAPRAEAVCGLVGAVVSVNDFADRPPRPLADGEVVPLGQQRLADLNPQVCAVMHGSSFQGDGRSAIRDLADVIEELLGRAG